MNTYREEGKIKVEFTEEEIEETLNKLYGYKITDKNLFFNLLVLKMPKEVNNENFNCFIDALLDRIDPEEKILIYENS